MQALSIWRFFYLDEPLEASEDEGDDVGNRRN
jgi:hypothetical protein